MACHDRLARENSDGKYNNELYQARAALYLAGEDGWNDRGFGLNGYPEVKVIVDRIRKYSKT